MNKCTDITLVEHLNGSDLLRVVIDNSTEAYWIYSYAEALKYVGQDVIVNFRKDMYKGELCNFINTFVLPTVVETLDRKDNIKLYSDAEDSQSNVSFSDIGVGEDRPGCIVYCTASTFKSSRAAVWQELIIRDKSLHTAVLRIFDYDKKDMDFSGKYIMTELNRNSYGFQSDFIQIVPGNTYCNPEIAIAKQYIETYFANDTIANEYMLKYNIIGFLEQHVDYETGYGLVRLAMELAMLDNMYNISKDVDFVSIGQALLAKRGYIVRDSVLSASVNNILLATSLNWPDKAKVLMLLDESNVNKPVEYSVMCSIESTINTLLEVRKGTPLNDV